jgi:hypothetical protein
MEFEELPDCGAVVQFAAVGVDEHAARDATIPRAIPAATMGAGSLRTDPLS